MEGSAFIIHSKGWACSNSVMFDLYTEPIRDMEGKIQAVRKVQTLKVMGVYGELPLNADVEIAFLEEINNVALAFQGRVSQVGKLNVINILNKTERYKEIISIIDLKNKGEH